MNKIITLIIILLTTTAFATESKEEKKILENIDIICQDTWCESPDYSFTFENLIIDDGHAFLYFTVYKVEIRKNIKGEYEHLTKYTDDICHFEMNPKENLDMLTDDVMEAIGDCLFPME